MQYVRDGTEYNSNITSDITVEPVKASSEGKS